jgi:hypothetical protein
MLFVATPISLASAYLAILFTHTGGPIFFLAVCLVPGLWFGLYFGKPNELEFWLALVVIQFSYWSAIIYGFNKLKAINVAKNP